METKRITDPDHLVSAYLQRPIRSYEEALKARESVRPTEALSVRLITERSVDNE